MVLLLYPLNHSLGALALVKVAAEVAITFSAVKKVFASHFVVKIPNCNICYNSFSKLFSFLPEKTIKMRYEKRYSEN